MTGRSVPAGAVSYLGSKRRREVVFTPELRAETEALVLAVRAMLSCGVTPPPSNDSRCAHCSILEACVPEVLMEARATRLASELYAVPEEE